MNRLRIGGILMIIIGVFGVIFAVVGLIGFMMVDASVRLAMSEASGLPIAVYYIKMVVYGLIYGLEMVTGILVLRHLYDWPWMPRFFWMGMIVMGVQFIQMLLQTSLSGASSDLWMSLFGGILVPALMVWGAFTQCRRDG
ncbi:MAG: hypothetical protein VB030_00705 [Eubacterium aggregans]|uniref:hypothetical protein n=1 Tax=Eubacterium aggregans TaxID=81409 RepID=UPI002B1FFED9|nr:hypothetical protein [Eubacterium aggregans]MEA5072686.1 hypothetical protein [Eubacterium aggregans]